MRHFLGSKQHMRFVCADACTPIGGLGAVVEKPANIAGNAWPKYEQWSIWAASTKRDVAKIGGS